MRRSIRSIVKEIDSNTLPLRRKTGRTPTYRFQLFIEDALWTAGRVHLYKGSDLKNKHIAFNNFQVNVVSAIEVLFKGIIVRSDFLAPEGIQELLKESISLGDAYKLLKHHNITPQYIIAETFSFSDFWAIGGIMQKLLGMERDFFAFVETYTFPQLNRETRKAETKTLLTLHPNWRRQIQLLYEERNKFVHEGITTKKTIDDVGALWALLKDLSSIIAVIFAEVYGKEL